MVKSSLAAGLALWLIGLTHSPAEVWVEIGAGSATGGGISNDAGPAYFPSMALDGAGYPVAAWNDQTIGNDEIYVRRWNGSAWTEFGAGSATGGGISNNAGTSLGPSLALDAAGFPVVAWFDYSAGDGEIYVRRWNGTAWVELGAGSASGGGISNNAGNSLLVSAGVDGSGAPVVAWTDDSGGDLEIYVRRWDGNSWVEMGAGSATGGGISNNSGDSQNPSLAIDTAGNPVVGWEDTSSGDSEVYVRRWDGAAWTEVGAGSASGGGISNNGGSSADASLDVAPSGNLVVAWADNSGGGNPEIFVRQWNGSSWAEMGAGSASGGGISNNGGQSYNPSLAVDGSGIPMASWQDVSSGNFEIYVRRWDGVSWTEVGAGSASGRGISSNSGISYDPCLALDSSGNAILGWADTTGGGDRIFGVALETKKPVGLDQFQGEGAVFLSVGGTAAGSSVELRGFLSSFLPADLALQVEVRSVGTAFTGVPTAESLFAGPGQMQIAVSGLANGSYHWQARTRTAAGLESGWVSFGGNPEGEADFVIAVADPLPVVIEDDAGRCGLLGIEWIPALAFLAWRRRKSAGVR